MGSGMFRSLQHGASGATEAVSPLTVLLCLAACFGACVGVAAQSAFGNPSVALLAFGAAVSLAAFGLAQSYPHAVLGWCNTVTLARAAMVAFLSGAIFQTGASAWIVFGMASLAFALDGVDGWLARQSGLISTFGARFDMETDAALGAVLALWLMASGTTGPEILALGFMRYAFLTAAWIWPQLQGELPEVFRRKAICVVQIAVLIALVCPLTPAVLVAPLTIGGTLLLFWSFLVDILWLTRRAG